MRTRAPSHPELLASRVQSGDLTHPLESLSTASRESPSIGEHPPGPKRVLNAQGSRASTRASVSG